MKYRIKEYANGTFEVEQSLTGFDWQIEHWFRFKSRGEAIRWIRSQQVVKVEEVE